MRAEDMRRADCELPSEQQVRRDVWMGMQGEHAWLEEVLGDRALDWVRAENARTEAELGDPTTSPLYERALKILENKEKIPHVAKYGEYWYNFWTDAEHKRGLWRRTTPESYRTDSPEWEDVIDVDALGAQEGESWVWKGHNVLEEFDPSTGAALPPRRTLVVLSPGGSDAVVRREYDLVEKRFIPPSEGGFVVTPAMKSRVSWVDKDTMLVGGDFGPDTLTKSGYPRVVKEWKRGTPLLDAKTVYEGDENDVSVTGYLVRSKSFAYEKRNRGTSFYTSRHQIRKHTEARDGVWVDLQEKGLQDSARVSQFGDRLLIWLRKPWTLQPGVEEPAGSLLSVGVDDFCEKGAAGASFQVLFKPTSRTSLDAFEMTKNYLMLQVLDTVKSRIQFWRWDAQARFFTDEGAEAQAAIRGTGVKPLDSEDSDEYFLVTNSFLEPSTLSLSDASKGPSGVLGAERLKGLLPQYDTTGLIAFQSEATSADGTKVPYFCICREDAPRDGSVPTLLCGYGGFEISLTPGYSALNGAGWLERGGCYVSANIRGGGEFGPSWHQAALKENRQKAYDDFIAVAEDLIANKITSPKHLGIRGGSNGGLLMGNMMVQRPDLFGAVQCAVPLLDMKRYSHLLAGASWMAEYGDPDTDDWEFLQKYSSAT